MNNSIPERIEDAAKALAAHDYSQTPEWVQKEIWDKAGTVEDWNADSHRETTINEYRKTATLTINAFLKRGPLYEKLDLDDYPDDKRWAAGDAEVVSFGQGLAFRQLEMSNADDRPLCDHQWGFLTGCLGITDAPSAEQGVRDE